jgi:UDP-N-acetylmuramoylalanine-D-glutamate ligase
VAGNIGLPVLDALASPDARDADLFVIELFQLPARNHVVAPPGLPRRC